MPKYKYRLRDPEWTHSQWIHRSDMVRILGALADAAEWDDKESTLWQVCDSLRKELEEELEKRYDEA